MICNVVERVLLSDTRVCAGIFDVLFSKPAIVAYILVVFEVIGILVANMMSRDLGKKTGSVANGKVGAKNAGDSEGKTDDTPEEEDRAPRFCMLCRIDENRAQYSEKVFDD
ncbi:MAG: hypothetical protein E7649_07185, partial [Ruminococcaceae bacterium]|nr:hypothetical protein [Oscillospiraceae bacterium]